MSPEASRHRRRIGGLLISNRLPFDYIPEGTMTREQVKEVADRSWGQDQPAPSLCCVCGEPTRVVVNIRFHKTPVCDYCCLAITQQTAESLTVIVDGHEPGKTFIIGKDHP